MPNILKVFISVALFIVWIAVLVGIWFLFDPEGFWQKLTCSMLECAFGFGVGLALFLFGMCIFDNADAAANKKRGEQN